MRLLIQRNIFLGAFVLALLFHGGGLAFLALTSSGKAADYRINMYFLGSILDQQEFSVNRAARLASPSEILVPLSGIRLVQSHAGRALWTVSRPDLPQEMRRRQKAAPAKFATKRVEVEESLKGVAEELGIPEPPEVTLKMRRQ